MKNKPAQCRDCPHWHRKERTPEWPWDNPWGDCDLITEEQNPLTEYDKPYDCPLEEEYKGKIFVCYSDDLM